MKVAIKLFMSIFTVLTVTIISNVDDVSALKSEGTFLPKFGSDTKHIVCGDQLCAQISNSDLLNNNFRNLKIIEIIADDPDTRDSIYSDGDTITIRFSEPTNKPTVQTKLEIDSLFNFSHKLGMDYVGEWRNPSTLRITILDATGNQQPQVDNFTVSIKKDASIQNAAQTSVYFPSISPSLTGSFEKFKSIQHVGKGGASVVDLPTGVIFIAMLPSHNSGDIHVELANLDIDKSPIKQEFEFIGDTVDLTLKNGASCTEGCSIMFVYFDADVTGTSVNPMKTSIVHDVNHNDIFEKDEIMNTLNKGESPGPYWPLIVSEFNSKFAIGGLVRN